MARRYHKTDEDTGHEVTGAPGYASMAGIIKLQPNRKKVDGALRSMLGSELSECETDGFTVNEHSKTAGTSLLSSTYVTPLSTSSQSSSIGSTKALPHSELPAVLTDFTNTFGTSTMSSRGGIGNNPSAVQSLETTQYEQMFGKLPDPIRLHEQTGAFDGQVVFVGHPSRDISAHQWSSVSFQWVNIGRYVHARGKIEGSLASDRTKGGSDSHTPLQFFKLAANNREKQIVENGRQKEEKIETYQPVNAEATRMTVPSETSSLTSHVIPRFAPENNSPELLFQGTTTSSLQTTFRGDYLEDPFIAPTKHVSPGIAPSFQSRNEINCLKGSSNLEHQFPSKPGTTRDPVSDRSGRAATLDMYQGRHSGHGETFYGDTNNVYDYLPYSALREVGFGEEASSSLAASSRCDLLSRRFSNAPLPENIQDCQQYRNESPILGTQATNSGVSTQDNIGTPGFGHSQLMARSLFPPPGLTVANPHRTVTGLNASASSYAKPIEAIAMSEHSASEATIVNAATAVLRFSDPDSMKPTQEYNIANGLGQQKPTAQRFKGPFFTDTKPTTSDPTALLSVHISEEQKLVNWFRDGHRPRRQQEYAKTLIIAAMPSSRYRTIGVIGQGSDTHKGRYYENTPPFVRLYEGLSEYAEELRNNNGRSYFTRAWKMAPPRLRDLGPDGNNSYYSKCFTTPAKSTGNVWRW